MKKVLVLYFALFAISVYGHDEVPEFEGYVGGADGGDG